MAKTTLPLTGAASIAVGPLLHAILRRSFAAVQLCADLPELADLQIHLPSWCEALLQRNVCTALRRNIRATAQCLESLPDCGVDRALLSRNQAAHRSGIAGSTLAGCVQVWRLPAAFDAEQVLAAEPPKLNAAWWLAGAGGCGCGRWMGRGGVEKGFGAGEAAKCSFCAQIMPLCPYTANA